MALACPGNLWPTVAAMSSTTSVSSNAACRVAKQGLWLKQKYTIVAVFQVYTQTVNTILIS